MKRIFLILCLITICNISYADIASVGYVDSVVDSLPTVAKTGSYNDLSNKPTNISSFTNDSGYITTSYHDSTKQDKLPTGPSDGKKYSLIWNGNGFSFEEFTTGGDSTPIDWNAIDAYLNAGSPSSYVGYGLNGQYCEGMDSNGNWFGVDEGGSCSDPEFAGMVAGDWYVDIPSPMNVKIEGRALCSNTNGTQGQPGDPDGSGSGNTRYCWCKMTSPAASRWVFRIDRSSALFCALDCANRCGYGVQNDSVFRSGVFSSVGQ